MSDNQPRYYHRRWTDDDGMTVDSVIDRRSGRVIANAETWQWAKRLVKALNAYELLASLTVGAVRRHDSAA